MKFNELENRERDSSNDLKYLILLLLQIRDMLPSEQLMQNLPSHVKSVLASGKDQKKRGNGKLNFESRRVLG